MQTTIKQLTALSLVVLAVACGQNTNTVVAKKKAELQDLKKAQAATAERITALEKEILKLDPSSIPAEKPKLVSLTDLNTAPFTHYINLQGKIDAENISYVTPRGMGGQVREIYVKKGDVVTKGKLLLKLDDAVILQKISTSDRKISGTRISVPRCS
jgi:biotin carboxyl carrier protein